MPENFKHNAEELEREAALEAELRADFPEANVRRDAEHWIYDVVKEDGTHAEVHVPRWEILPMKNGSSVPIEDVIRADLKKPTRAEE